MALLDGHALTELGWSELCEHSWSDLLDRGLPRELADFSHDLGDRSGRPILVFTMPMMQAGVPSLAIPLLSGDGILLDPFLLDLPDELTNAFALELGYMLYPGWDDPVLEAYDEMVAFASVLGRALLRRLPRRVHELDSTVELTLRNLDGDAGARRYATGGL
ncbi:MAG TPA: hypothetical protein VH112_02240 [Acidimicrobiales bacterium]|jgi:hypothetical protein|nr:hypothetical protein [Acidimicrobiales bacterium]